MSIERGCIGPNVVDDCEGMTEEDYWRGMDEAMQDEEGDEPFCNCSAGHGIEEMDFNKCDCCGKPIEPEEVGAVTTATEGPNATSHRGAACGASGGLPGCASNGDTEK